MTVVFPGLDSPEFDQAFQRYLQDVESLVTQFRKLGIAKRENATVDDTTIAAADEVLQALSDITDQGQVLRAYISSFVSTDSRNTLAQAKASELAQRNVLPESTVYPFHSLDRLTRCRAVDRPIQSSSIACLLFETNQRKGTTSDVAARRGSLG